MSNEQNTTQKKKLSPKLDVVFQALFGDIGSERITGSLLESILKEQVKDVDLSQNIILRREYPDDKLGVLDVFAKINGVENCNIELQIADKASIIERILFYWSRIYSRQIKSGYDYEKLNRSICILITDFSLSRIKELEPKGSIFIGSSNNLNELSYHTKWLISEENQKNVVLTNLLEIHIISLAELREKPCKSGEDELLLDWLEFLENPESRRLIEKMKDNDILQEAEDKLCTLSEDERMQRIADLREKAILDEKAIRHAGEIDGRAEGIVEGEKKAKLETAKKMLNEKIPLDVIARVTGLTEDEIMS